MPAPGERLRRLPVPVRPASRETIGSFLNRLALANSLRIPHLLALAGIRSSLRSFTPATDDTRGWSESTPERIADLAGRPLAGLAAAFPLLAVGVAASGTPMRACGHCTAAKNITGLVIIRARPIDYLCTRHQQWLRGLQRPALAALPEVPASQRRHDKHTRHVPDPEIARAHQQARAIVAQWLEADWHPALTGRWHERNQQLAATAAGTLHADVVTHPEMLAVARLLIATRQGQRVGPIDIAGRLDFPYPGRPHQLEPLYACLSQLARQYARHTP
jgi:hypothetical protein